MSDSSTSAGPCDSSTAYPPSDDSSELKSEETLTTLCVLTSYFWTFNVSIIIGLAGPSEAVLEWSGPSSDP